MVGLVLKTLACLVTISKSFRFRFTLPRDVTLFRLLVPLKSTKCAVFLICYLFSVSLNGSEKQNDIDAKQEKKNSLRFRKWKDVLKLYLNSLKKKEAAEIEDNKVNNREERTVCFIKRMLQKRVQQRV